MSTITIEQALLLRPDGSAPRLLARSPGFDVQTWMGDATALALGFGDRPAKSIRCPLAVFAKPLTAKHVAIVRVRDDFDGAPGLRFHFLVVERSAYESWMRDPFILAARVEPTWQTQLATAVTTQPGVVIGADPDAAEMLPTLHLERTTFSPRTLDQVRAVLKRIKASALKEGEDPEAPDFERTAENSESPALLGGAQILVDGGRLAFERPDGDLAMVAGLWLLLPEATRRRLWPTSFAFSSELDFDVLVMPRLDEAILESYTTEEQAADYPEGSYEVALQRAAEQGTQADLDGVFHKRDSHHVIRLAVLLLLLVSGLVLVSRWLDVGVAPNAPLPIHAQQTAAAAGIIAAGEPWTAMGMLVHGKTIWKGPEKQREQK